MVHTAANLACSGALLQTCPKLSNSPGAWCNDFVGVAGKLTLWLLLLLLLLLPLINLGA
jgi:hypothetical protein